MRAVHLGQRVRLYLMYHKRLPPTTHNHNRPQVSDLSQGTSVAGTREPIVIVEASLDELALTKLSQYWPSLPLSQTHALWVHAPASEHSCPSLLHP